MKYVYCDRNSNMYIYRNYASVLYILIYNMAVINKIIMIINFVTLLTFLCNSNC